MIPQNTIQGQSQSPIGCNLCGSNGASVRCDKCQSMAFCISCDDMYHRHPKRRYHLRKAVALQMSHNTNNKHSSNSISDRPPISAFNCGHPSKMPIPPPRRKRKGFTLSSIKDTFANTGSMFRRFVSQDKPVPQSLKFESQQSTPPLIAKPIQPITLDSHQNQTRVMSNNFFRPLPPTPNNQQQKVPPPPPPKQVPQIYENYRKASLPMNLNTRSTMSLSGRASSSMADISIEPEPNQRFMSPSLPPKLKTTSLQRNNCSLHDLTVNQTMDGIPSPAYPPVCGHFMPNSQYYLHPWGGSSLTHSMEDLQIDHQLQDDHSDHNLDSRTTFVNRQSKNRFKKSNMKRCQSAFQMYPMSQMHPHMPPGPPYLCYYFPSPYGPPPPSPPLSVQSMSFNNNSNRRPSVDNYSSASSSRGQKSSAKFVRNNKPKLPEYVGSGKELSDSGERSVTSSSRQPSEFEDEEDFFSVSNDGTTDDEDIKYSGQWACRFCTFLNDINKNICEICSKTHRKTKKASVNNQIHNQKPEKPIDRKASIQTKTQDNDIIFDEKLIDEQKQVEKELMRRLENERRIEKQNQKIIRKQQLIRTKSLELQADKQLAEKISENQNQINSSDNQPESLPEQQNHQESTSDQASNTQSNDQSDSKPKSIEKVEIGISTEPEQITYSTNQQKIVQSHQTSCQSINSSVPPTPNSAIPSSNCVYSSVSDDSANGVTQYMQNSQNHPLQTGLSMDPIAPNNQVLGSQHLQQFASFPIKAHQNDGSQQLNSPSFGSGPVFVNHQQQCVPIPQLSLQNPILANNMIPMPQMPQMSQLAQSYQMPNYYCQSFSQMTGSQTRLDQLANINNPLSQQQIGVAPNGISGHRFASYEDLQTINNLNDNNKQKSQIESGLHLIQLLREAEKSGFTADDVEVAINFSPNKPLEWLEENWHNMVETVMTLANNQIMQNEKKRGTKKLLHLHLVTEKEAKVSLRLSKGNIWQSIEKCVKRKEENKLFGDAKSSFSLKISGLGSGQDNEDANFVDANDVFVESVDHQNDSKHNEMLHQNSIKTFNKSMSDLHLTRIQETHAETSIGSQNSIHRISSKQNLYTKMFPEHQHNTEYDGKTIQQLLTRWKNEKQFTEQQKYRLRLEEREKQQLHKMLELQKKLSPFQTDDSEEEQLDLEVVQTLTNQLEHQHVWTDIINIDQMDSDQIIDQTSFSQESDFDYDQFSDDQYEKEDQIEYIDQDFQQQSSDQKDIPVLNQPQSFYDNNSDKDEYYSNDESDCDDQFEQMNARIQSKINALTDKIKSNKTSQSLDHYLDQNCHSSEDELKQINRYSHQVIQQDTNDRIANEHLNVKSFESVGQQKQEMIQFVKSLSKNHYQTEQKKKDLQKKSGSPEQNQSVYDSSRQSNNSSSLINYQNSEQHNLLPHKQPDQPEDQPESQPDDQPEGQPDDQPGQPDDQPENQPADQPEDQSEDESDEDRKQYYRMMRESELSNHLQTIAKQDTNPIDSNTSQVRIEAQEILRQIDQTLKQSLEDLELIEQKQTDQINEPNQKDISLQSQSMVTSSQSSFQLPVFGKQKGSDKLRKSSLHKIESTLSNSSNNSENKSSETSARHSDQLPLKVDTVPNLDIGSDIINQNPQNCLKNKATNPMINKLESAQIQQIDQNKQDSNSNNASNVAQSQSNPIQNYEQITPEVSQNNSQIDNNMGLNSSTSNKQKHLHSIKSGKMTEKQSIGHQYNRQSDSNQQNIPQHHNQPNAQNSQHKSFVDSDKNHFNPNRSQFPEKINIGSKQAKTNQIKNSQTLVEKDNGHKLDLVQNQQKYLVDDEQKSLKKSNKAKLNSNISQNTEPLMSSESSNQNIDPLVYATNQISSSLQNNSKSIPDDESTKQEVRYEKRESPTNSFIDKALDVEYSLNFGWARTEYECEICASIYPINEIVAMISCTHFACKQCLQQYFTVQIRERQRLVIACPFCDEPNIDPDDDDNVCEYLGLMDQLIRYLVPSDVHELFQRKVRDRALMRDPNFRWCTQCSSGFIAPNPQAKTVMCPDCKSLTCTKCRKTWKKQHFDISCEQFAEWEKAMDPEYAEQQLDKHLKEFGIDCPNCKFKYQLAKGGCMHFRCIQCSYDFCGGCQRPFKMGNRCGHSPFCEKLGLHSHHPRNCLFYLRDKETKDLQSLLDKNNVEYKTQMDSQQKSTRCPVMEQKDTDSGMKDQACGRYIESAGLCRLHYKEYLGDLIWNNNIDPIIIFNEDELELVLKRESIRLPQKSNKEDYKQKLINMIEERLPLQRDG